MAFAPMDGHRQVSNPACIPYTVFATIIARTEPPYQKGTPRLL
jgi:hypothetical protein